MRQGGTSSPPLGGAEPELSQWGAKESHVTYPAPLSSGAQPLPPSRERTQRSRSAELASQARWQPGTTLLQTSDQT